MAIYRQIQISFWQDKFILNLTPEEKYFYLYLMTNSKTTQCGIYEIPKNVMVFETGYNLETVDKLIQRFVDYKKILYDTETTEILMLNWLKYNGSTSPKVITRIENELKSVKSDVFITAFKDLLDGYGYSIDTVWIHNRNKNKTNTNNKTNNQHKAEDAVPYEKIKKSFNETCKSYPTIKAITEKRKPHVKARWEQLGKDIDHFELAFKKIEASSFCKGNNDNKWQPDFDWLIKNDTNIIKVLEGKYDYKGGKQIGTGSTANGEHKDKKFFNLGTIPGYGKAEVPEVPGQGVDNQGGHSDALRVQGAEDNGTPDEDLLPF